MFKGIWDFFFVPAPKRSFEDIASDIGGILVHAAKIGRFQIVEEGLQTLNEFRTEILDMEPSEIRTKKLRALEFQLRRVQEALDRAEGNR